MAHSSDGGINEVRNIVDRNLEATASIVPVVEKVKALVLAHHAHATQICAHTPPCRAMLQFFALHGVASFAELETPQRAILLEHLRQIAHTIDQACAVFLAQAGVTSLDQLSPSAQTWWYGERQRVAQALDHYP